MAGDDYGGAEIIDGVADVMELDFPLEDGDLEMMVAGPADDQYNDLLLKEVLQLFGSPPDAADPAAAAGAAAGAAAAAAAAGAPGGAGEPSGLGPAFSGIPLLLPQPSGGLSGLGNAARQVEELLKGLHPSMRGTSLEDWLKADGPIVAIPGLTAPPHAAPPAAAGSSHAAAGTPVALPALSAHMPPPATPPMLADAASMGGAGPAPRAGAPVPLQQQLQLQQMRSAAAAAYVQPGHMQQQQHAMMAHLASSEYASGMAQDSGSGFAQNWQLQQQYQQQQQEHMAPQQYFQQQQQAAAPAGPPQLSLQQQAQQVQQAQQPDVASDLMALFPSEDAAAAAAASDLDSMQALFEQISGLQQMEQIVTGGIAAAAAHVPPAGAGAGAQPFTALPAASYGAPAGSAGAVPSFFGGMDDEAEDEEGPSSSAGTGVFTIGDAAEKPATLKRFSDRQKARISKIEGELAKLQIDMQQMKKENAQLKRKNVAVEQQLQTQQQLQQLATAVAYATAAAATAAEQRQQAAAAAAGGGASGGHTSAPPLALASGLSPPNSQKKLLLQLSDSMRPQDKEMMAVAALTWPKLHEWYCKQVAMFRDALQKAPSLSAEEAEKGAKEVLRSGRYKDLLVLISRPDLSARLLQQDMTAPAAGGANVGAANAAGASAAARQAGVASWAAAAVEAMQLSVEQRGALAAAWQRHREAAEQRAARRQELLSAIRNGFLVHLQKASPEDIELGKPLALQGLSAMESLRLVVRQEHVSAVQIACGLRKVLTSVQQARLAVAAWPWYPDPAKWAPLLVEASDSA